MEIGEKIRRIRIERGLTQEELADRAELSKGFISQIERDLTSPSIATLEDILTCLGRCRSADLCRCFRCFSNLFLHIFRFLSCFAIWLMYYRIIRFCFI